MANNTTNSGNLVECLPGELAGVWSGWKGLGDREIVREASAKGTHIELAYRFLEIRRHCSLQEAKAYFSSEVEIWISGLLKKKQVHRASHILKNVGKIPIDYIRTSCLKCKDQDLRDYLARHVESSFSNVEKEAWDMIQLIAKYEQIYNLSNHFISNKCLEEIINLPESIKDALYTELYFNYQEPHIIPHLKSNVVWNFLLINNKLELIKKWIDINYNDSENIILCNNDHNHDIQMLFIKLKITNEMIASTELSNGMFQINNLILNYLSRYGVFTITECDNIKLILSRLLGEKIKLPEFSKILSKPFCNVNDKDFLSKLDTIGLSRNYLEDYDFEIVNFKNKKLFSFLKDMCKTSENHKDFLELGIIETVNYLSSDTIQYFKHNPIVSFTLLFMNYCQCKEVSAKTTLNEVFIRDTDIKTKIVLIPRNIINTIIFHFPYLKIESDSITQYNHVTMYQVLDGYKRFNSATFFKWRLKKGNMPDCLSENLVKRFGQKEKLSYINYLKEARPNMAANILQLQQQKFSDGISLKVKSQTALCTHIFALKHIKEIEIVSGCVSFLEILGINSESLRLHITAALLIKKELQISIENLLEASMYNNQSELKLVLSYLERSFHSRLNTNLINNNIEFIQALCTWDVIIRFAKMHNTSLPTTLLKFLASHDAWFEFILVAHIFIYPMNQIVECLQHFENISLQEHLLLAFINLQLFKLNLMNDNQNIEDQKIRDQDCHKKLCQEIEFKKSNSSEFYLPPLISGCLPLMKSNNTFSSHNLIANISNFVDDLWMLVLKCHKSQDPSRSLLKAARIFKSPILIVLATYYKPLSISSYHYSWLIISAEKMIFTKDYEENLEKQIWPANTVLNLFYNIVSNGLVNILSRGFQIFFPENPLRLFFEFLEQCTDYGNFKDSKQSLASFINDCSKYKCNKMINWQCSDETYLENSYWIQIVIVKCIIVTIAKTLQSSHAQIELLNTLIKFEFHNKFLVDVPNFESLLEYTRILSDTVVNLNFFCFDTTEKIDESEAEIEKCIDELVTLEDYTNALRLSKAANFSASKIILAQYRSEFKQKADQNGVVDSLFWSRCASDFKKYDVCYVQAAQFFVEYAEKVKSYKERYEILKLALEILEENSRDRQTCDTVEMIMWKSCILAGPENVEIKRKDILFKKLKTELLSIVNELQVSCFLTEPNEKEAIKILIGRLLDANRLDTALRISAIFNCRNRELQVLMLCLSLAEGETSPYHLTEQQRSLLSESDKPRQRTTLRSRGLERLPSSSSLNLSANMNINNISDETNAIVVIEQEEQIECLLLLTNLIENLNHGVEIGIRILLCFRIAVQLRKKYQVLLTLNNPMQFLQEIVTSPCDKKLDIARDIITAYQIENKRIVRFLAEEIVAHITQVIKDGKNEPTAACNYNMNLQSVIELCKDSSLLGLTILDMTYKLLGHSCGEKRSLDTLKIIVELLIKSHDCFTASCNMEGIASVLRKCQQLANSLQNLKHWSLLVRLLTGVGRFTEMSYIFQILKEYDQFEVLLGRGLDKIPGLRMALLDFLKRHCPDDKDLFNIVALHFRLYYEIATMWVNEAKDLLNDLVNDAKKEYGKTLYNLQTEIKFIRNEITEKRLQLAITNYTHATQYFLQDNKLNLASRCSHQAQLVALQISLLNFVGQKQQFPCILNLNSEEINYTISRHLNFSQALILARAYDHHVDWASAIYSHCLIDGESKYLKDFIISKRLTTSIAIDCAKKYRLEKNISISMTKNMQTLVAQLKDNQCKYVLASQLGFRNIVEEMLEDPAIGAYLKDTVFKKRYVTSEFMTENVTFKG